MFVNNLISGFSIGILNIRFYGIIYALGFLITYLFLRKERINPMLMLILKLSKFFEKSI